MSFPCQIKIGCQDTPSPPLHGNITLQYSTDFGTSWNPVKPSIEHLAHAPHTLPMKGSSPEGSKLERVSPDCLHELTAPSVYYWNSAPSWRREVIPLAQLQICGWVLAMFATGHKQIHEIWFGTFILFIRLENFVLIGRINPLWRLIVY